MTPAASSSLPDEPQPSRPPRPNRRDSVATYRRLIAAAGRLLDHHQNRGFNLTEVAADAGVSTATVYRYFGSTEQLVDAYLDDFVAELEQRRRARPVAERSGTAGLRTLADDYVELVLARGRAMIHGRSPSGIVERYQAHDPDIVRIWVVYAEPVAGALDELGLPDRELRFAILLWNAIFHAREVLDLRDAMGWAPAAIGERLTAAYLAALRAGIEAGR
jgi:AcrR family transcriptional regulator